MNSMDIRQKLILLVSVALAMLAALGGFAWYQADQGHQRLLDAQHRHKKIFEVIDGARSAQVHFKTQVQEWKNILLRGRDAESFDKYLKGFKEEGKQVVEYLGKLQKAATALGIAGELKLDDVTATFGKLEPTYLEALKQYDRAAADPAGVVDKAVKGMDREPTAAIEGVVKKVDELATNFAKKEAEEAAAGYAATKIGITIFVLGALVVTALLAWLILNSINVPLAHLERTMLSIAATNDLTQRAKIENRDEIGRMAGAFNAMVEKLQALVRQVSVATREVNVSAGQLSTTAHNLRQSADQQSESVSANAASIEELTVSIATVADTAEDVRRQSSDSMKKAAEGNRKVAELGSEIRAIQNNVNQIAVAVEEFVKSTSAITGMTQEVREIADQTNLLALNAAIEAARAGEQGRGFAVVADEVRKLAEKSGSSAGEIDGVAKAIILQSEQVRTAIAEGLSSIQASAGLAAEVEGTLTHARESVEHAGKGVQEIAWSVGEQKTASTEIAQNMERIATAAEESSSAAQGMSEAASGLKHAAGELDQAISDFRV
jgi:methyl-accepting chemotaxis protein